MKKRPKTGIVCTIGPASRPVKILEGMMRLGMTAARLNFAHGTLRDHAADIRSIREASRKSGIPCDILADLPGPKIRLGRLRREPVHLRKGRLVRLTDRKVEGTSRELPVSYEGLSRSVRKGGLVYLNDGFLQLKAVGKSGPDLLCRVLVGGSLLSFKGVNLPGAEMKLDPVTGRDLEFLEFGLDQGLDLFGVSFMEKASDIGKIRAFAAKRGKRIRAMAKIERVEALRRLDSILGATDMVMVARGDLGVQIPLEEVPMAQKRILRRAGRMRVPAVTATQMLESMVRNLRPTRAEAADVANAVLDGTSALMLSEETAVGEHPLEAVDMMARIALQAEPRLRKKPPRWKIPAAPWRK
jgi:pyruvate kinase